MIDARRLAALALAASLAACEAGDVVIADRAPAATSTVPPIKGPSCADSSECAPNAFCQKPACTSEKGVCVLRPLSCDELDHAHVCGCDEVTYWNDCLRRQAGASTATPGECMVGKTCSTPDDCGLPFASCAKLFPPGVKCDAPLPGTCWLLPPTCPLDAGGPKWSGCAGPGPGPGPGPGDKACKSVCDAIRDGSVYRHVGPGDPMCSKPGP